MLLTDNWNRGSDGVITREAKCNDYGGLGCGKVIENNV